MPSYSYKCNNCNAVTSVVHGLRQIVEVTCKKCQSNNVKKLLKGSGFHITGPGVYKEGFSEFKQHKPTADGRIFTGKEDE